MELIHEEIVYRACTNCRKILTGSPGSPGGPG